MTRSQRYWPAASWHVDESRTVPSQAVCIFAQGLSNGPPKPFKLTESPGDTHLLLKREYKGEQIEITTSVNDQVRSASYDALPYISCICVIFGATKNDVAP